MPSICRLVALSLFLATSFTPVTRGGEALDPASAKIDDAGVAFYDVRPLGIEGQGWTDVKAPFDRLPARAEKVARKAVWNLSHDSAGLAVRFVTDATSISARWTCLKPKLEMPHMAGTGVSGVDLYVRLPGENGAAGKWRWLAVGKPTAVTTSAKLVGDLPPGVREYLLYLPLYNGVSSVEIGVPKASALRKADARPEALRKPILFYGTSITQGASATRAGTCHPAILGRHFDRPVVNLGFSGNGTMDVELAPLLAEIDAAVYVIDCVPNMTGKTVAERAGPFVLALRKARPGTPIVLVEDRTYADAFLIKTKADKSAGSRAALKAAYDKLVADGVKGLSYLPGDKLLGEDGDDTADSSHPTDLGFRRQADAFIPVLSPLLK